MISTSAEERLRRRSRPLPATPKRRCRLQLPRRWSRGEDPSPSCSRARLRVPPDSPNSLLPELLCALLISDARARYRIRLTPTSRPSPPSPDRTSRPRAQVSTRVRGTPGRRPRAGGSRRGGDRDRVVGRDRCRLCFSRAVMLRKTWRSSCCGTNCRFCDGRSGGRRSRRGAGSFSLR